MAVGTLAEDQAELKRARVRLAWSMVPKIPLLIHLLLRRLLGLSETAQYLDLRTDVTLTLLRSAIRGSKPRAIAKTQALTLLDPGVKGRIWISNAVCEVPPERGVREALMWAIRSLGGAEARAAGCRVPDIVPVEAEWTGYRRGATRESRPPAIPEAEKYGEMMKECSNATTVLYFHGGAYYLCDPATHRQFAKRLAKAMGGRVYSVRYRLAPQHPFPAALLDALVSYLTLLYPPPGSLHEAVSPRDIVFGGDSAGGNLALALTQTILQLRRRNVKIAWFGVRRSVPLPAGITLFSPWLDIVQSMPSWSRNQSWDYLPEPSAQERSPPPADAAWPARPARRHLYVDDALRLHPLVSAHLARSWAGAPPVWVSCGWECLADEDRYLVAKLRADGVAVAFEEYEAMPHVFAAVLPRLPASERCVQGWAEFVTATRKQPKDIPSSYKYITAPALDEVAGDPATLTPYNSKDVLEMARAKVARETALALISRL
ncbi:putative lipase esterase [Rosellinia necatrix]|uniref:Putative lipase esterase n=1 Tax=Rosellinia necatrix TaxID=77044 RepID=A0A1W2TG17_ROSNE|nr:putative lipase esterase [Rosellinia necatrix]